MGSWSASVVEEIVEPLVNALEDAPEVFLPVFKVKRVSLHHQYLTGIVVEDEVLVAAVNGFQIVQSYGLFIVAVALLDIVYQMRNGAAEIYHQVGISDLTDHLFEETEIGVEIPLGKMTHIAVALCKDIDSFIDGTVLDDGVDRPTDVEHVLETFLEEIYFQGECPSGDVFIIVFQVGIVVNGFKVGFPSVMGSQHTGEGCLATPYVSCYGNVHVCVGTVDSTIAKLSKKIGSASLRERYFNPYLLEKFLSSHPLRGRKEDVSLIFLLSKEFSMNSLWSLLSFNQCREEAVAAPWATIQAVVQAACRLNPPVMASISRASPAKKRPG